ncbi:hypothetical protein [uncultured Mediterranean phage uvDeep-CGR0-KM14-C182]|nr:hypothetical protein [uncultured Mediterranean phage uvDeep-CGR0-KM14-C182]
MKNATPINHGRIPYLCSAKTSTGYCTNNADVVLTNGPILCNKHYTIDSKDPAAAGRRAAKANNE